MSNQLNNLLDSVVDQASFLQFVDALRRDREADVAMQGESVVENWNAGPMGSENGSIESFLDAAHGWAIDSDFGKKQALDDENLWKKFAVFLYCGKIYE